MRPGRRSTDSNPRAIVVRSTPYASAVAAAARQFCTWWSPIISVRTPTESSLTIAIFMLMVTYVGLMSYSAVVLAMWAYGLTPGKWMLGIVVVRQDTGVPVGFWRMALRQVIGQWVAAIVCYLGFIWALFDANKQGWHDKIAKTLVVRTR